VAEWCRNFFKRPYLQVAPVSERAADIHWRKPHRI
jgi:hypothetical protein